MKIAVFGATGRVGKAFCEFALEAGHELQLLVRTRAEWMENPQITVFEGNARHLEDIEKTLKNAEAVFSGLGTDKTTTLSEFVQALTPKMEQYNIHRVVTIGTAGILDSRNEPGKYRFETNESNRKLTFAAEEHAKVYEAFKGTALDWTIVCPTYLPDGPLTREYRTEINHLPLGGKQISTADTAHFAYQTLMHNKTTRARIGIAY